MLGDAITFPAQGACDKGGETPAVNNVVSGNAMMHAACENAGENKNKVSDNRIPAGTGVTWGPRILPCDDAATDSAAKSMQAICVPPLFLHDSLV